MDKKQASFLIAGRLAKHQKPLSEQEVRDFRLRKFPPSLPVRQVINEFLDDRFRHFDELVQALEVKGKVTPLHIRRAIYLLAENRVIVRIWRGYYYMPDDKDIHWYWR